MCVVGGGVRGKTENGGCKQGVNRCKGVGGVSMSGGGGVNLVYMTKIIKIENRNVTFYETLNRNAITFKKSGKFYD